MSASLDDIASDAGADAAWDGEIKERIRKYDAGRTNAIPGLTVFEELDKRLAKVAYDMP
jgi:hypothetical protein